MKQTPTFILTAAIALLSPSYSKKEDASAPAPVSTEKLTVVTSDVAPCLNGLRPSKEPMAVLRKGDLVYVLSENKTRLAQFELKGNQVRVFGDRIVTERGSRKQTSSEKFEEMHRLTAMP